MTPAGRSAFLVAALCALAACEQKKPAETPVPLPQPPAGAIPEASYPPQAETAPSPGSGPAPADAPRGRAGPAVDVKVPDSEPLNGTKARMHLIAPLVEGTTDAELSAAALDYLVRLGETEAAQEYARKLLAKGPDTGGYEDVDAAAAGLATLVRTGDPDAVRRTFALAKEFAADGTATVPVALLRALSSVQGAQAADAMKLLAQFAKDDTIRGEALTAIAEKRGREGLDFAHSVAVDSEDSPYARGAAVASLLAAGDARAAAAAETLNAEASDEARGSEAIDGLAVPGLAEALPVVRAVMTKAAEQDSYALELRSTAQAYVAIRGAGKGTEEDFAYLRSLLGKDDGDADDELRTALWILGDDKEVAGAAKRLADFVNAKEAGFDDEPAVDVLEAVALRAAGAKPPFDKLISAAAAKQARKDAKNQVVADPAKMRIAAAYAYLASNR